MAVIYKKKYNEDTILAIWKITEDYDKFRSFVRLEDDEIIRMNGFRNHKRKLEYLSVRALLQHLLEDNYEKIVYGPERKPYLKSNSHNISISHSKEYTSILLSKKKRVGLDLEFMSDKILRIANKFLREEELKNIDKEHEIYHLYLHWCAKEALYKICDKEDINFVTNLNIEEFSPKDEGQIFGIVNNKYMNERFTMEYFTLENYSVVWCIK